MLQGRQMPLCLPLVFELVVLLLDSATQIGTFLPQIAFVVVAESLKVRDAAETTRAFNEIQKQRKLVLLEWSMKRRWCCELMLLAFA